MRMADAVRHRGPDGEGHVAISLRDGSVAAFAGPDTPSSCFAHGHSYLPAAGAATAGVSSDVLLAHRRLAIVDLTPAGHQPMSYADGRYWIVFNGEIYNHLELRSELLGLGNAFASLSDTEVILAAYSRWGADCLERLNGMFSFVLVDRVARRVFAARDRFGVKPLYYWISPAGYVALASEIKQFTVLPGWRARLNRQRAYDFLSWGLSEHTGQTLFDGVGQLRGGEAVHMALDSLAGVVASGTLPSYRWYRLQPQAFEGDRAQASARFRDILVDSIRLRLRSDVPVGSCLSGGLDSSAIVCLAHRLLCDAGTRAVQRTFTAYSEASRFDERPFAEEVIGQTGAQATFVCPRSEELFAQLPRLAWHMDEPFSSTSMFAQWRVFEAAGAAGVKVMLDGQGADELLGGYPVFWGSRAAGLLRGGRLGTLAREIRELNSVRPGAGWSAARQMAPALLPDRVFAKLRRLMGNDLRMPRWLSLGRLGAKPDDPFVAAAAGYRRSVESLSVAQLLKVNLPMLLHWEDRNSMAHSVEARVPFLDYRLVEFSLGLPEDFKLSDGWTKRVLRDSMVDVLPTSVRLRRDKIGFETPEQAWMVEHAPAFRQALERAAEVSQGIIRADAARSLLDDIIDGRASYSYLPWRMISFGVWVERFGVDCTPR